MESIDTMFQELQDLFNAPKVKKKKKKSFLPVGAANTVNEIWKNFITHATYLQDESLTVEGIHIYGTPLTTSSHMAFSCRSSLISEKFSKIPKNTDIVLTHLPPYNILDGAHGGTSHWGSEALKKVILEEIRPKVHLFGHVHEDYGYCEKRGVMFVNAAIHFEPIRDPIYFDFYVPL